MAGRLVVSFGKWFYGRGLEAAFWCVVTWRDFSGFAGVGLYVALWQHCRGVEWTGVLSVG